MLVNLLKNKKLIIVFSFFFFYFSFFGIVFASDLNGNGITDKDEAEVVVSSSISLPVGEYIFNNLIITNNSVLTLEGDPTSSNDFKGVKINAVNITIDAGSSISADGKGYGPDQGPGAGKMISAISNPGGSYGGNSLGNPGTTYGSATKPNDLGSGGITYGGGAMRIVVSDTFTNNGIVSTDGNVSSSGGSIYVTTKNMAGSGIFRANGGSLHASGYFKSPGGGGRIAIYYQTSSFNGTVEAKGGCGSYDGWSMSCSQNGTVGFFDESANNLYINNYWNFQKNDSPFNFNNIFLIGAKVAVYDGVEITANNIVLDKISALTLSGGEIINVGTLSLLGRSNITVIPEKILSLKVSNLNIENGSMISADSKGYIIGSGSPGTSGEAGASYGGKGGGVTAKQTYGSDTDPVDFGSGTESHRGGGAIRLVIDNNFKNDGIVSVNGIFDRVSGGSIYITANNISGTGTFQANGGNSSWPYGPIGGGGGRIAIYYKISDFSGTINALAGTYCFYGCAPAAENGTVVMKSLVPICTVDCFSNVLFLPGIEASRLYKQKNILGIPIEDQLWEPNVNSDVEDLYLNQSGQSLNNIYTKDVIDKGLGVSPVYDLFIKKMNQLVIDKKITEWQPYAYDWRQDVEDIVNNGTKYQSGTVSLVDTLQSLVGPASKNGKVTIIAHSNGGLLAKALLKKLQDDKTTGRNNLIDNIDNVVLVASPQVGTPEATFALLHGYNQKILGGFLMNSQTARQLALNMPSSYGLLPSEKYYQTSTTPIISFDPNSNLSQTYINYYGSDVNSFTKQNDFILGKEGRINPEILNTILPIIGNEPLLNKSEELHNKIDNLIIPSSIKLIQLAGWGKDTLVGIKYVEKTTCDYPIFGLNICIPKKILDLRPVTDMNGDKTVVSPSALYDNQGDRYWLDLSNSKIEHKNIFEDSSTLQFIENIITQNTFTTDRIYQQRLTYTKNRNKTSVHSPVTLGAYDSLGNFTGKICEENSDFCQIVENIPNSSYMEFGEGKYLNYDEDDLNKTVLKGIGFGIFTYESERVTPDNTSTIIKFIDIPVTPQTTAEITTNPNTQTQELKLDINSDEIMDITLQPSNTFDPVVYLQVMKKTIENLDITKLRKNGFINRIDNTIKAIQKGKIVKTKLKVENFMDVLEKIADKKEPKRPKPHRLSKTEVEQLLIMLDQLLINLNK